jgi:hypothetical protein
MAISKCVESSFRLLPRDTLLSLKGLISTAKTSLSVLKVAKQKMSLNMDILLAPLQLKQKALQSAIDTIRQGIKIIPQDIVAQCPDVGAINLLIEKSISAPLEAVQNILFDINQLLAQKALVNAEILSIDTSIQFFTDLESSIDTVLST